jgi:uncharacterized phiE125 gp8 family phage protein
MPLSLQQIVPPLVEPVTVQEAKLHLRIEQTDEDTLLAHYISAAREDIELYTRRQLLPATWVLGLDTLTAVIQIPRPPLLAVVGMEYYDEAGVLVPIDSDTYRVDAYSEPARLWWTRTEAWPVLPREALTGVLMTYQAGYRSAAHIPASIKQAMLLLVGDFYEHREARLDMGGSVSRIEDNPTVGRLLWKHRVLEV